MSGLGKLKHDAVAVISMAADNGDTVIIIHIQMEIFFIDLGYLFYGHDPLAVDNGHMKRMFDIIVNRMAGDICREAGNSAFQKIVMIDDQGLFVQKMKPLDIVKFASQGETGTSLDLFICNDLHKLEHLGPSCLIISYSRFVEGFDTAQHERILGDRAEDIADAFSLDGLYITVQDQHADGPADRITGAVIGVDQNIFRGEQFAARIIPGFDFLFDIFVYLFIFCFWHGKTHILSMRFCYIFYYREKKKEVKNLLLTCLNKYAILKLFKQDKRREGTWLSTIMKSNSYSH